MAYRFQKSEEAQGPHLHDQHLGRTRSGTQGSSVKGTGAAAGWERIATRRGAKVNGELTSGRSTSSPRVALFCLQLALLKPGQRDGPQQRVSGQCNHRRGPAVARLANRVLRGAELIDARRCAERSLQWSARAAHAGAVQENSVGRLNKHGQLEADSVGGIEARLRKEEPLHARALWQRLARLVDYASDRVEELDDDHLCESNLRRAQIQPELPRPCWCPRHSHRLPHGIDRLRPPRAGTHSDSGATSPSGFVERS
mmetsp:Transcript_32/g.98  ORF Transcript_32/g.98 Transcript_32/m.98 type:complete len:256 (-) Transcript_32:42-809(-)